VKPPERVTILQPYVPTYRVEFFRCLRATLSELNINLTIAAGEPSNRQKLRGDAANSQVDISLKQIRLEIGSRSAIIRRTKNVVAGSDLVITEQARLNLDTYKLLFNFSRNQMVALWGHGHTVSRAVAPWEDWLLATLTNKSDWFFSYTDGGRESVTAAGFPAERVTVVNNSIDTATLRSDMLAVDQAKSNKLREQYGLKPGCTGIYIGGLDQQKRPKFLMEAARAIRSQVPDFKLLVLGDGANSNIIASEQAAGGPVIWLGRLEGYQKAEVASVADALLIPGLVGLIAVESFAMGLPIITTDWPWHAPEFEYLKPGFNSVVTRNDLGSYVNGAVEVFNSSSWLARLRQSCLSQSDVYTVENMAIRYSEGIRAALDAGKRPKSVPTMPNRLSRFYDR
jgi:glycosyltransferase involved in cell wall biosynthesis